MKPTKISVTDVTGRLVEGFRFADGTVVCVEHNVWMLDAVGIQIGGPAGADYYFSERGYNCATPEDVAVTFYRHARGTT